MSSKKLVVKNDVCGFYIPIQNLHIQVFGPGRLILANRSAGIFWKFKNTIATCKKIFEEIQQYAKRKEKNFSQNFFALDWLTNTNRIPVCLCEL